MLADFVLSKRGLRTRLVHVRLAGRVAHAVCYVTENNAYLDYNNRKFFVTLERSGPDLRTIANTVADSLSASWTTASEFTYSYETRRKTMTATVSRTGAEVPVPGQPSPFHVERLPHPPASLADRAFRRVLFCFTLILVVLVGVLVASLHNLNRSIATSDWVNHTHALVNELDALQPMLASAAWPDDPLPADFGPARRGGLPGKLRRRRRKRGGHQRPHRRLSHRKGTVRPNRRPCGTARRARRLKPPACTGPATRPACAAKPMTTRAAIDATRAPR